VRLQVLEVEPAAHPLSSLIWLNPTVCWRKGGMPDRMTTDEAS